MAPRFQVHGRFRKRAPDYSQLGLFTTAQLDAVRKTGRQVVHEVLRVPSIACTNAPARDKFGVRAKSSPRPHVTVTELAAQFFRHVLFFRVAELPCGIRAITAAKSLFLPLSQQRSRNTRLAGGEDWIRTRGCVSPTHFASVLGLEVAQYGG
jgi:hypothetical protein